MTLARLIIAASILALAAPAHSNAQDASATPAQTPAAAAAEAAPAPDALAPNPDESAASLNRAQKVEQTYTLQRTIDGEVVETTQKTVAFSPGDPIRESEAVESPQEALARAFDNATLTRTEAYEEAKLDFVVADADRDDRVTEAEFLALAAGWNEAGDESVANEQRDAAASDQDALTAQALARTKFALMVGADAALTRKRFIREYMVDFDAVDVDGDKRLEGEELIRFRAVNRGAAPDQTDQGGEQ